MTGRPRGPSVACHLLMIQLLGLHFLVACHILMIQFPGLHFLLTPRPKLFPECIISDTKPDHFYFFDSQITNVDAVMFLVQFSFACLFLITHRIVFDFLVIPIKLFPLTPLTLFTIGCCLHCSEH